MGIAAYLNRHRYWVLGLAFALALPGGILTTLQELHWLSRSLIAGSCVAFSLALFAIASEEERVSTGFRWSLRCTGAVAMIGAGLELLPDQLRSSTALYFLAGALALLVGVAVWTYRNSGPDRS